MTRLVWDRPAERTYEKGVDRGVLYLPNTEGEYDNGVAWNGITQVSEVFDNDIDPVYLDGVKYIDTTYFGAFAASLTAFTYPDEFYEFEGIAVLGDGLLVDDQDRKVFGLGYRTMNGNAIEGLQAGYTLHLVYNLTAVGTPPTFQNGSNLSEPAEFSWDLTAVPEHAPPYRPTAYVKINSAEFPADLLVAIENILYGEDGVRVYIDGNPPLTDILDGGTPNSPGSDVIDGSIPENTPGENPRLPFLTELLALVLFFDPKYIVPAPDTGFAQILDGGQDLSPTNVNGIYSALPGTRLVETDPDGFYILQEA